MESFSFPTQQYLAVSVFHFLSPGMFNTSHFSRVEGNQIEIISFTRAQNPYKALYFI